jgi:hypothetical protein
MSDEIVKADGLGQLAERVRLTKAGLAIEKEQRRLLNEFVRDCMVLDTDYGKIPGTDKPTLLKPGAEKLVDLFRCTPEFILEQAVTDFDKPLFYYRFKVRLYSEAAGRVLAEGVGSANSREARYRWRNGGRKCPSCGKETIILGKPEYGGGWVCFAKKGGCGSKFKPGDKTIEGQQVGRVENDDIADLDNTILKMAKKRALVDGAIAVARGSDLFTQDLEDFQEYRSSETPPEKEPHKTGAYGPPEGTPARDATAEAQFRAASKQVTGSSGEYEEETRVIIGRHKGKSIASLDAVSLQQAIDDVAAITSDPANKTKRNYAKAARAHAALLAARDVSVTPSHGGATAGEVVFNAEPTEAEMAEIRAREEAST